MYAKYCASCHGLAGGGDGPAAPALKSASSNLTLLTKSHNGKFPRVLVYETVCSGTRLPARTNSHMPAWGNAFVSMDGSRSQIPVLRLKALGEFIASVQVK